MEKILYITSSIALCLLMAFNLSCNKEKDLNSLGSIYGMVVEDETGNPISGARIILEKESRVDYGSYYWGATGSMMSDADGHFRFVDLYTHIKYFVEGEWGKKKVVEQTRYKITIEAPNGYYVSYTDTPYKHYEYSETIIVTLEKDRVHRIDFRLHKKEK